jgi:hypothetical protein
MPKKPARENRRGSPEAIAKRRAGRAFNDLYESPQRLDGRTAKRRARLFAELESGKIRGSGRELKALEVLSHVDELLALGEPLANIRKACRPRSSPGDDSLVKVVAELHRAYSFRPEAYRFVGLDDAVLRRAGVLDDDAPRPSISDEVARSTRPPPSERRARRG